MRPDDLSLVLQLFDRKIAFASYTCHKNLCIKVELLRFFIVDFY